MRSTAVIRLSYDRQFFYVVNSVAANLPSRRQCIQCSPIFPEDHAPELYWCSRLRRRMFIIAELHLRIGDLDPHVIYSSLCPLEPTTQTASRSVQPFCSVHGRASLYLTMGRPFPSKLPLLMGASGPRLIHGSFLGPTRVLNPNGISIGSDILQGSLPRPTDRPHATIWITIGHIAVLRLCSIVGTTMQIAEYSHGQLLQGSVY